jgi:NADH-quinone oxidoreductase subunit N
MTTILAAAAAATAAKTGGIRFTVEDLGSIAPIGVLALAAFAVLLIDPFLARGRAPKLALSFTSLAGIAAAAVAVVVLWARPEAAADPTTPVARSIVTGALAQFLSLIVLASAAIAVLYSVDYTNRMQIEHGEYYGLMLFAAAGMLLLVSANDLVTLFIAFELMSLAIYALVGIARTDARSGEGAMKYFVLGAFSSGFLLYGIALLYGATGTVYLDEMRVPASTAGAGLFLGALALLIVGFGFKVGAVPFHAWIPDAYQGAPAAVTGYMAVAVKAAAFGVFVRILGATGAIELVSGETASAVVPRALWALAVLTMALGNFAALAQSNLKRLLAYSGIAHSGYILVGLTAAGASRDAAAASLFYLATYASMTIGAFAVVVLLRREGRDIEDVDDLRGLGQERPGLALAMTIFLVSLVGIPPTAGFMGKLWVFKEAVQAGYTGLVVIGVLTTMVSVYYYLRPIVVMYMYEPVGVAPARPEEWGGRFAVVLAVIATLYLGIAPTASLDLAAQAVRTLVP